MDMGRGMLWEKGELGGGGYGKGKGVRWREEQSGRSG